MPLRVAIGFGFLVHGYAKLSHDPAKFAAILVQQGKGGPIIAAGRVG